MKTADVKGKQVAKIRQQRVYDQSTGRFVMVFDGLEFTDGTLLIAMAHEGCFDGAPGPYASAFIVRGQS